jgi:hypothetical protein
MGFWGFRQDAWNGLELGSAQVDNYALPRAGVSIGNTLGEHDGGTACAGIGCETENQGLVLADTAAVVQLANEGRGCIKAAAVPHTRIHTLTLGKGENGEFLPLRIGDLQLAVVDELPGGQIDANEGNRDGEIGVDVLIATRGRVVGAAIAHAS